MTWIIDVNFAVAGQKDRFSFASTFLEAHLVAGGRIILSHQLTVEISQIESSALFDYELSILSEFDKRGQADRYSLKELQKTSRNDFTRLQRAKRSLTQGASGKCKEEILQDWPMIEIALHSRAPILTYERAVVFDCICRLPDDARAAVGDVFWVIASGISDPQELLTIQSQDGLRSEWTINHLCDEVDD